jgi:hypothetical protein
VENGKSIPGLTSMDIPPLLPGWIDAIDLALPSSCGPCRLIVMSVEEIKQTIAALSLAEQGEISAFLFHLRHKADRDYQESVDARLSDRDPAHWVTPEEFEERLDQK